jgi:hypothetical protein
LEGLAGVAATQGKWDLAARLCGAHDVLHASLGVGIPPANPAAFALTLAGSRAALGDDAFAAAHEAGQSWSPTRAFAEAAAVMQRQCGR